MTTLAGRVQTVLNSDLAVLVGAFLAVALCVAATAEEQDPSIGYPSVDAARQALTSKPGVRTADRQGWYIVQDPADLSVWSFTPQSHEAHPAAVKRTIVQKDGTVFVRMNVLCGASKEACDRLVAQFNELNAGMREKVQEQLPKR